MQAHNLEGNTIWYSRCTLENYGETTYNHLEDKNPKTKMTGIRRHQFITALVLRILGKIKTVYTESGKTVYLNKNSFAKWEKWRNTTQETAKSSRPVNEIEKDPEESVLPPVSEKIDAIRSESIQSANSPSQAPISEILQPHQEQSVERQPPAPTSPPETSPAIKVEIAKTSPTSNAHKAKMFADLSTEAHKDLSEIWTHFFDHFEDDVIQEWKKEKSGKFTLNLSRPLKLWIDSKDETGKSYPKGGTILMLDKKVSLSLNTDENSITFNSGHTFWCNTPIGKRVAIAVKMKRADSEKIEMKAGCKIRFIGLQTEIKSQTKDTYLKDWKNGIALGTKQDHEKFLNTKISELANKPQSKKPISKPLQSAPPAAVVIAPPAPKDDTKPLEPQKNLEPSESPGPISRPSQPLVAQAVVMIEPPPPKADTKPLEPQESENPEKSQPLKTPKETSVDQRPSPSTTTISAPGEIEVEKNGNTISVNPLKKQMLTDLSDKADKDLAEIWSSFFSHFEEDVIQGWKEESSGKFTLNLSHPLKLWIDSKNQKGLFIPKGGTVLTLDKEVSLSLHSDKKSIKFYSGYTFWCETPMGMQTITPVKMQKLKNGDIKTEAGRKFPLIGFRTTSKNQDKDSYLEDWKNGVPLKSLKD